MNRPLVSVLMPVYNSAKFLPEAIGSILGQTYANLEFIIINDGSTDNSRDVILSYNDSRIRFYDNDKNRGIVYTRNRCIELAKGKYIALLDSDDVALPKRLELQVGFLENNTDHGLVGSYHQEIDSTGKLIKKVNYPTNFKDVNSYLTIGNCFCNSSTTILSSWAKELKHGEGFDLAEDYDMYYRLSKRTRITNLSEYTTLYRVHGNNITIKNPAIIAGLTRKIYQQILADYHIQFTENELDVHTHALFYNNEYFRAAGKLDQLADWIKKLCESMASKQDMNEKVIYKVFCERWVVICAKNKNFTNLFAGKLMRQHPGVYLGVLLKKLTKQTIRY